MDAEIRQFRHAARTLNRGRTGTAVRYTPELRRQAVDIVRIRMAGGMSLAAAARLLGLRSRTVALWLRKHPQSRFRPVAVGVHGPSRFPDPGSWPVVLITPQGFRVEGLDAKDVAAVVRSLS
jgi:hypothetical protein